MNEHPARGELLAWLEGGDPRALRHLESCEECLEQLDELSRMEPALMEALASVTLPDPGFLERVHRQVERRRRDSEAWAVLADLFSLSWRTADVMWPDDG